MIRKLHHNAYRCRDSEETRRSTKTSSACRWCRRSRSARPRPAAPRRRCTPSTASTTARTWPSSRPPDMPFEFKTQHDFDLHIALEVGAEVLQPMLAKGRRSGIECRGPSDHGMIDSIYFRDPNGYVIELCAKRAGHDAQMDPAHQRRARQAAALDRGQGRQGGLIQPPSITTARGARCGTCASTGWCADGSPPVQLICIVAEHALGVRHQRREAAVGGGHRGQAARAAVRVERIGLGRPRRGCRRSASRACTVAASPRCEKSAKPSPCATAIGSRLPAMPAKNRLGLSQHLDQRQPRLELLAAVARELRPGLRAGNDAAPARPSSGSRCTRPARRCRRGRRRPRTARPAPG